MTSVSCFFKMLDLGSCIESTLRLCFRLRRWRCWLFFGVLQTMEKLKDHTGIGANRYMLNSSCFFLKFLQCRRERMQQRTWSVRPLQHYRVDQSQLQLASLQCVVTFLEMYTFMCPHGTYGVAVTQNHKSSLRGNLWIVSFQPMCLLHLLW